MEVVVQSARRSVAHVRNHRDGGRVTTNVVTKSRRRILNTILYIAMYNYISWETEKFHYL